MLEDINEQIDVLVAFTRKTVVPLSFTWGTKKFSIKKVNIKYSRRIGQTLHHIYAVSSINAYFKINFNTENNKWMLEEVYYGT